ncbi:hypothetical protein PHYPSEUDO_003217 [Phytophthora pseudosyringae]|uniref:Uncharacterized protein n=1 Tax=Phytophthora pseudosyringae TaxID=221518 RepID=A0A8T1VWI8_9STRA|nr:hypothetical protein PHYPSEUDO_003217 [Phytophthora pseudosyringae]
MALSEYEAKRQRRIEANQRKLQALDVPKVPQRARPNPRKKRVVEPTSPVRRSLRQSQQRGNKATEQSETEPEALIALESLPPRPKRVKTEAPKPLDLPVTHPAEVWTPNKDKKQHRSSSQIEIRLEDFHDRCLGTQLLPVGKQTVMQGLCPPGFAAKFSKMSGVQPWKNAVALFVNVESDSPYDNVFHQEELHGRRTVHFQWFGQSRWHEESPLVVRLRAVKRGDETLRFDETYDDKKERKKEEPLLLFLRHTQGPYIYCGRLGYLGHRPASRPLEFRWQLLDVDSLQWGKVRGLLEASSVMPNKSESAMQDNIIILPDTHDAGATSAALGHFLARRSVPSAPPRARSRLLLPPPHHRRQRRLQHRVVQRYRRSRPLTVRAMDGAAALGKLELVQWLHSNRPEGCSSAAFNTAAANRHLNVLEWLYEFYPQVANPAEEIVKAAECVHVEVIRFLRPKVRREQMASALEAAAANGHVPVLATLLERPYSMRTSLLAAAGNGQAQVVQYLLERGYRDKYTYVNPALVKAAEGGHCDVVELLVDKSDKYTIAEVLMAAATDGRESVVKFLLEKCKLEKVTVARALKKAAEHEQCEVVKLLLGDFALEGENRSGGTTDSMVWNVRSGNSIIDLAFISAVERGRSYLVKLLINAFSRPISDALIAAGSSYQLEILEFILDYCAARHLENAHYNESITTIAETAAWSRNVNMAKLLLAKCETLNTGGALRFAVDNEDLEMIRVLVAESNVISIQDALVTAAVTRREKLLEVLLEYSNADTIEQAGIDSGRVTWQRYDVKTVAW